MKNDICSIYNIKNIPIIPEKIKEIMKDSARGNNISTINYSEAISFTHCDLNIKDEKIYLSEQEYKDHYDYCKSAMEPGWSIPDGCISHNNKQELLSVFCVPNIINQKYIIRKIEKLFHVARDEINENTSLHHKKFNKIADIINLNYYIYIPHHTKCNKLKNVIKKIYRNIIDILPICINIKFNIFQTYGDIEKFIWVCSDGSLIYNKKIMIYKESKLKTIKDIKIIILLFENNNEIVDLSQTFFINF